ncbi:MAG: CPBP family glutamic-type intramembrane protease, partial [Spirochaetia bacterium]|nr:CPBP family glutamic-type intramembrane protease [Spirochaetia bacterium]
EEILVRFGLMTFLVWLFSIIFRQTSSYIYWMGILFSAFVFAAGHLPVAFQAVQSPSLLLISYILLGNSIGGIIFGYIYMKKGLESAMISHIFAHVVMIGAEYVLN